jgi:rRNA maturation endonuclease Nob1
MNPKAESISDQAIDEIREALAHLAELTQADIEKLRHELEQERWATDPMGLMELLDPLTWRYTIAAALHRLADWIES